LLPLKWSCLIVAFSLAACADIANEEEKDLGSVEVGQPFDFGSDMLPDVDVDLADSGLEDFVPPPFCDSAAAPIPDVHVDEPFAYPPYVGFTRDVASSDGLERWMEGLGGFSTNFISVLGDEGTQHGLKGMWLPYGSDLHFRLGDHFPYEDPEIVPEYLAATVLVDHKSVEADYEWEWKGRDYEVQSFFMSVPHQTTQVLDVKIPASAFPEARSYDVVVLFFKPNAMVSQMVQMFRMTLYYGGFDVPEHPCFPIAEKPELTPEEKAYEQRSDWLSHRNRISIFRDHPSESTKRDSVFEVEEDATSVEMNMLFRGTSRENFVHEHVPMKIVTFVDYVAQDETMLIALPQETREFVHRDTIEIPLNPGPETVVWLVGIYNPWNPTVSWDNQINPDFPSLYWAYRSNRLIFRRAAD